MRPIHSPISGRGAIVVVLIALFVTVAEEQPAMVFPSSASDIGTIQPAPDQDSAEGRGEASKTVEAKARPANGHKDIEYTTAIVLKNGSPKEWRQSNATSREHMQAPALQITRNGRTR